MGRTEITKWEEKICQSGEKRHTEMGRFNKGGKEDEKEMIACDETKCQNGETVTK